MQPTEYEVILQETFPFWGQLSKEQKELMIKNTMTVQYPKGEQLHRGSLDCIGVLLVQSGQFRTYLLSEDGKDITLYRLSKGEVCLLTASCILKEITFDVFVTAETVRRFWSPRLCSGRSPSRIFMRRSLNTSCLPPVFPM